MLSNVAVILLFSFLFGRIELIEIKTFDGYSGLHFEETESIRLYKDEWKILTNVNLTMYKNQLDMIRNNVALIRNCCEEFKMLEMVKNLSKGEDDTSFSAFISPELKKLNDAMTKYENNDNNMFKNINKHKRFKSNAVSELVLSYWSETLIEDEFKKMSVEWPHKLRIEPISKTSFIWSILNSIARSFEHHPDDFITSELSFIMSTLSAVKNGSENVEVLFELPNRIKFLILYQRGILSSFSLTQEQYVKIVSLVGQRHPIIEAQSNILKKDTLTDELNRIRDTVSQEGLDLPTKITSLFSFFQSPEVQMINDQIYICFRIPLISIHSSSHFTLFKVTSSIHTIRDNLYTFIHPNHEFIVVDEAKQYYTTLTTQDFKNCYQSNNFTSIICKQTAPIMSTLGSNNCEINVLLKNERKSICNVRLFRNNADIFVQLLKPNSWLLTLSKAKNAQYMCDGMPTQDYLIRSGLLTIDADCKLDTGNVLLMGHNSLPKSKIYEHRNLNVHSFDDNFIDNILLDNLNPPMHVNDIPLVVNFGENEKLLLISYALDDIKMKSLIGEIQKSSRKETIIENSQSFFLILIVLFIFVFLCLLIRLFTLHL